jgi:hypothetical protein
MILDHTSFNFKQNLDDFMANVEISRAVFASTEVRGYEIPNKLKNSDLINIATTTLAAKATANEKAFLSPSVSSGLNVMRRFLKIPNSDLRETFQTITNKTTKPISRNAIPTYA